MRARAFSLVFELGLVVLAFSAVCALEIALHAPAIDRGAVLGRLPRAALAWSAVFGALVVLVHGARALLARRMPERRVHVALALGLGLCGAFPLAQLAGSLVEGAWIAEHPQVRLIRAGLFVVLELAWLGAWALYALALTSTGLKRGAILLGAIAAIACASLLLQGPLRAYLELAQHAVFPVWLLVLAITRAVHARWPRAGRALGLVGLVAAAASLVQLAVDRDAARYARAEALASSSFLAIAETLVLTEPTRLGKLDFERAPIGKCPEARTLPALPLSDAQRANVIFLSIDTLRRDVIGKRVDGRAVAPSLEAFGKHSVFFERAVSPAAGTLFSLSAALTGHSVSQLLYMPRPPSNALQRTRERLPRQHLVFPDWPSLRTKAMNRLIVQDTPITYVSRRESPLPPFLAALDAARSAGERGFFWLHLVEPHEPYKKHKGFDFGDDIAGRYYSEVAYDDAILGKVLAHLAANGYFESSLIAIFSDHGEALGEDGGYIGHGVSMKGRFTDVPLYVRYPGVTPRVSRAAVSLTSLLPSVLHFVGQKVPATVGACSLLEPESALASCPMPVSTSYGLRSEMMDEVLRKRVKSRQQLAARQARIAKVARFAPELAFTTRDHRYLVNLATGAERLFERGDGSEQKNVVREQPAVTQRFRLAVTRWADEEATRIACALEKKKK